MQMEEQFRTSASGNPESTSWLSATGQEAKLRIPLRIIFCGVGVVVLSRVTKFFGMSGQAYEILATVGALAILVPLFFPIATIRCSECKTKVLAHFMRHSSFNRWLVDLETAKSCPKCGHVPDVPHSGGETGARSVA
jgi:hypothetical protein